MNCWQISPNVRPWRFVCRLSRTTVARVSVIKAIAICGLVAAATERTAPGQQPTRLPAVVVNAAPDKPGARKVAGVVRDTSAFAVATLVYVWLR